MLLSAAVSCAAGVQGCKKRDPRRRDPAQEMHTIPQELRSAVSFED
jgi:hypothetical protein